MLYACHREEGYTWQAGNRQLCSTAYTWHQTCSPEQMSGKHLEACACHGQPIYNAIVIPIDLVQELDVGWEMQSEMEFGSCSFNMQDG